MVPDCVALREDDEREGDVEFEIGGVGGEA